MLKSAKRYEDEIVNKLQELMLDVKKFKYMFNSDLRIFAELDFSYGWVNWAVVDNYEKLIGIISYYINVENSSASQFFSLNFSNDPDSRFLMARSFCEVVDTIFNRHNCLSLSWTCSDENPILKSYKKVTDRMGGSYLQLKNRRGFNKNATYFYVDRVSYLEKQPQKEG